MITIKNLLTYNTENEQLANQIALESELGKDLVKNKI